MHIYIFAIISIQWSVPFSRSTLWPLPEVPSCLKVLRLRPERRFCRLGDLSKEATAVMAVTVAAWRVMVHLVHHPQWSRDIQADEIWSVLTSDHRSKGFDYFLAPRTGKGWLAPTGWEPLDGQVGWKHGALIQRLESQRKACRAPGRAWAFALQILLLILLLARLNRSQYILKDLERSWKQVKSEAFYKKKTASLRAKNEATIERC